MARRSEICAWLGVKQTSVPKYLKTLMDAALCSAGRMPI